MNVVHKVTGYDRGTERLELEFPIPEDRLDEFRDVAHVPKSQRENFAIFPLDRATAQDISGRFQFPMNLDQYDWFFEPMQG